MARILVAEDNYGNREYLASLLRYKGHDVGEARDGVEALQHARRRPPDLVITDLLMPRMDGFQLARALRADPRLAAVRILVCTATFNVDDRVKDLMTAVGILPILRKPMDPETVLAAVEAALAAPPAGPPPVPPERFDEVRAKVFGEHLQGAVAELERLRASLEQTVVERTQALRELNQDLMRFTAAVSHDLRSPLRSIEGHVQALEKRASARDDEAVRECMGGVRQAATQMERSLDGLAEYVELSERKLASAPVDPRRAVEAVRRLLHPKIEGRDAVIAVEGAFPPVQGDALALTQALVHLVENAITFVAPGTAPRVRLRAEPSGGNVRVWVEDNGIGIDPRFHEKVFEPFTRLESPERYPGAGMGLALVRKGLRRMGGSVGVESRPGAGARFWLELPAATP